jgi:hypothetical protein
MDRSKLLRELYLETMHSRMLLQDILQHQVLQATRILNPLSSTKDLQGAERETFQRDAMEIEVRIQDLRAHLEREAEG